MNYDFNSINDRVWIGEDFWSVPLEDWRVQDGRVECLSTIENSTLTVLPFNMADNKSSFDISVRMGLLDKGKQTGSSGIIIGSKAYVYFDGQDFFVLRKLIIGYVIYFSSKPMIEHNTYK